MHLCTLRRPNRAERTLCWDHSSFSKDVLLAAESRSGVVPGMDPGVDGPLPDTSLLDIGIRQSKPVSELVQQPKTLQYSVVARCAATKCRGRAAGESCPACPFAVAASSRAAPVGTTDRQPHL